MNVQNSGKRHYSAAVFRAAGLPVKKPDTLAFRHLRSVSGENMNPPASRGRAPAENERATNGHV